MRQGWLTLFSTLALLLLSGAPALAAENGGDMLLGRDGKMRSLGDSAGNRPAMTAAPAVEAPGAWGSAGALLFLLGLAGGAAALVWQLRARGRRPTGGSASLALVERLPLGGRRELLLVRAGERLMVLASSTQELKLVTVLPQNVSPAGETDMGLEELLRASEEQDARAAARRAGAAARPEILDWPEPARA